MNAAGINRSEAEYECEDDMAVFLTVDERNVDFHDDDQFFRSDPGVLRIAPKIPPDRPLSNFTLQTSPKPVKPVRIIVRVPS